MTVGSRVLGGRYRLGSILGQGGMAVVYRAEDLTLGRNVAVKVLREQLSAEPEVLERFRREARAAARLNHPNIIAVYDVGQDGPSNYIVMEYVEGHDLRELIREQGALPPERVVDIGCQVAAALEYAHRAGLVHRDIKSQNVLVTPEGKAKVADFGIAVALGERSLTQTGMVIGSVHYMAPEQAEGRPTTPASDVYALGVVLYEMATGRLPFTAESPLAVARLHLDARPVPPHQVNPRLPPQIAETILACLEKDPAVRPASAALVAAALRGQRTLAAQHTAPIPAVGPAGGRTGRQRTAQPPEPTQRQPASAGPATGRAAVAPTMQTDMLLSQRQLPQRPPRRSGGGFSLVPFLAVALVLAAIGAVAGWILAGPPDLQGSRPTPAPVVVGTAPPAPTRAAAAPTGSPVAAAPTQAPTRAATPTPAPPTPTSPPPATPTPAPPTATRPPPTPAVKPGLALVPNVVGRQVDEATRALAQAGLKANVREENGTNTAPGTVLAQDPPVGNQVLRDSSVTLRVARASGPWAKPAPKQGFMLVPNVEGMDERDARKALQEAGFKVEVDRESSDRKGQVINQNPGAGDTVRPGATVKITIGN